MKKITLLTLLLGIAFKSYCQPQIINPTFPSSVDLFDLFEVSFTMGASYSNPYDPDIISIYALFIAPDNTTYRVNAFYYEDYEFQKIIVGDDYYEKVSDSLNNIGWRIRFTPTNTGNWKFRIYARDSSGAITQMPNNGTKSYNFYCNSVTNAEGFISKANSRYLQQDVVKNGHRYFHSFFPVGLNIAWYSCRDWGVFRKPRGIYDYERYIDSLDGNANYMRIFLNRYQYLSLYGPEYTHRDINGDPVVYFDNTINQKDSAELDHIISYARQHGVAITLCIFSSGDFKAQNGMDPNDPSIWGNNPYNTIINCPCYFYSNVDAKRIAKNLIRYIISRWGYATNIMDWELWNETDHMLKDCQEHVETEVAEWHDMMAFNIKKTDPFNHNISTSMSSGGPSTYLYSVLFDSMDFVQQHYYDNIRNAESRQQLSYRHYNRSHQAFTQFPSKPFFMEEFGFAQSDTIQKYQDKDPKGIDLHNFLWSSLFSTTIGSASFWWWPYVNSKGLFKRYTPLMNFCNNLPILSESFTAHQTGTIVGHKLVFPNDIETYYMINASEDSIYGWSQDTAFAYQSLRWLTDYVHVESTDWGDRLRFVKNGVFDPSGYVYTLCSSKRPQPSSNSNTIEIPITNQPVGSRYRLTWYNSKTGYAYSTGAIYYANVHLNGNGDKVVSFNFPSFIRNIQQQTITNTFGDVVFSLILDNLPFDSE